MENVTREKNMQHFEDAAKWFIQAGDEAQEIEKKCFYKGLSLLSQGLKSLYEKIEDSPS